MPPAISPRHYPLLLAAAAVLVLAPGIWDPTGITGKDEFFLGLRTPMEMIVGDHWLVPFLDGAPRIRKPPLLYWLGRASFETFGISLASARIIGVLFSALLVAATTAIGGRLLRDPRGGLIAGGVLLGCLGLHSEGRRFMLDVPVAALSAAAFWSFLIWLERAAEDLPRRRAWPWLALVSFLLAAGFLVKGPVVGVVFGGGVAALAFAGRLPFALLRRQLVPLSAAALLFLALALPWFVIVKALHPRAAELTFADEMESRQFFNLTPEIVLGLINVAAPWAFVFIAAVWPRGARNDERRLLAAWFLATFLPFLFLRTFDRYLVGSLVPLAILIALALPKLEARWPFRLGLVIVLLLGGALAVFAWRFGLGGWYWLLPPCAYLVWAWWWPRATGHRLAAPIVFHLALLWGVFPALGINAVPDELVALGKSQPVAFFRGPQPALLPILSRQPHRHYGNLNASDAAQLAASRTPVFAASHDTDTLRQQLSAAGFRAVRLGSYDTLASHGSGLRFARPGATWDDWRLAWETRRLDPLAQRIDWFAVVPR